ncbi:MAG: penicillin-binding protein 2 [Lentisphaeria bacterium]|jgi:cell division protein FtsI/penicillin-binding protein 2
MHSDLYNVRLAVLGLALASLFAALSARLYRVQVARHEELLEKARAKVTAITRQTGNRGLILDDKGRLLAGNQACRTLYAEPRRFEKQAAEVATVLRDYLKFNPETVARKFAPAFRPERPQVEVVVARDIEIEKAKRLEAELRARHLRGFRFEDTTRRYYPKESLAASLIGLTDSDGSGLSGIEQLFDAKLKPGQVESTFERDRKGRWIPPANSSAATAPPPPPDGWNVHLTIDETIQHIVERELRALMEKHQPKAAYALMANPRTGAILAFAQLPAFNPNDRASVNPGVTQNRMLISGFEPGSVMKAVPVCAALDAGLISLDQTFFCENGLWLYRNRTLRDSGHRYGTLAVREIIQKSSNIGTAKIALLMGPERLHAALARFGFGQPTGLGFPNEIGGIFQDWRRWDGLKVTRVPIGQGVLVTAPQLVQAYCALANHGSMPQLHLVTRLEDTTTGEIHRLAPSQPKRQVASPRAVRDIVTALKTVTQKGGTATTAAVPGFEVAGKTGTAQKVLEGSRGYTNRYFVSFAGFVPADNPAFVLLVAADEPSRNGYYGGAVCGPVFSRIAKQTLEIMQIPPTHSTDGPLLDPSEPTIITLPGYDEFFEEDFRP